jgi:DNA-directed RNA polymerase subunit RPC12/RpoP
MCRVIPLDAHRKARQGAAERGASGRATVEPPLPAASLDSSAGPSLRGRIVKRQDFCDVYACGRCGNPTWIVTANQQTRCAACNTRALNLKFAGFTAPIPKASLEPAEPI